jgi:hypothetical protein
MRLTTQLVSSSRKCGSIHSVPHMLSWPSASLSTGTTISHTSVEFLCTLKVIHMVSHYQGLLKVMGYEEWRLLGCYAAWLL